LGALYAGRFDRAVFIVLSRSARLESTVRGVKEDIEATWARLEVVANIGRKEFSSVEIDDSLLI
jgi:hypothetical protein